MKWFIPIILVMFVFAYPWGRLVATIQLSYGMPVWAGLYILITPWVLLAAAAMLATWWEEENYRKKRNKEK
jgi:hypothetical protein